MKKIIALLLAAVMALALCACGASGAPSGTSGTGSTEPAEKSPIKIEDIDWSTQLGIIDGERQFVLSYTNNSKYTIAYFCMTFTVKDELSEADQKALDELKTEYDLEDSDIPGLELEAESEKLTDPGESEENMEVLLGWEYVYSQDLFDCFTPDILELDYIGRDSKIHTEYYDFLSGNYSEETETREANEFPYDNPMSEKLPELNARVISLSAQYDGYISLRAYGASKEDFNSYVNACKEKGFTVDPYTSSDSEIYRAYSEDGYYLNLNYYGYADEISVSLDAPDESDTADKAVEATPEPSPEPTEEPAETEEASAEGIRAEVKEAVDSYEELMNEYCDFMQKYSENPSDMSILMEYATYMAKYEEAMDKIDALDDMDMNDAELSYYLAATARIEQRLLTVMG